MRDLRQCLGKDINIVTDFLNKTEYRGQYHILATCFHTHAVFNQIL